MAVSQYIGARYVPLFYSNPDDNTNNWHSGVIYEPLTIVTDLNQSYTSKKEVPSNIGRPSENPEYWVLSGSYNAQVATLSQNVAELQEDMETAQTDISDIQNITDLLAYKTMTIHCDGTSTDGQILDAWYSEHQSELNALNFNKKRNMLMDSPYSSALRISMVGSQVLEFYGITNIFDDQSAMRIYGIKLQRSGSKVLRVEFNLSTGAITVTDFTSNVHSAGTNFNLMIL